MYKRVLMYACNKHHLSVLNEKFFLSNMIYVNTMRTANDYVI